MDGKPILRGVIGALIACLFVGSTYAFSIGTSPGVLDIGEVDPGRTYDFEFYLLTNSDRDLIVSLGYKSPQLDLFRKNHTDVYRFIPKESSNAEISSWVKFPQNPTVVTSTPGPLIYVGGQPIRPNGKALVSLAVPEDAEPCYYIGTIDISPRIVGAGAGTGVGTIGITRFTFVFKVRGEVTGSYRDGIVVDMEGEREADDKARIDVLYKNTGVCTELVYVDRLSIFKDVGGYVTTTKSGPTRVEPGETKVLSTYWVGKDMKPGNYRAQATVNYFTGYTYGEKPIVIPEIITRPPPPGGVLLAGPCGIPTDIILILAAVLLIIYWLDFDRKWLLLVLATIVIIVVGSILMCNMLPWWAILLPVFFVFLYFYWKS
ncbi:MAG: hypothetical protein JXB14_05610 [Candidatus Altiarchaeota archaeon]|nr:hypothetical protein [Candidatus Altiarchaeota archaeon]